MNKKRASQPEILAQLKNVGGFFEDFCLYQLEETSKKLEDQWLFELSTDELFLLFNKNEKEIGEIDILLTVSSKKRDKLPIFCFIIECKSKYQTKKQDFKNWVFFKVQKDASYYTNTLKNGFFIQDAKNKLGYKYTGGPYAVDYHNTTFKYLNFPGLGFDSPASWLLYKNIYEIDIHSGNSNQAKDRAYGAVLQSVKSVFYYLYNKNHQKLRNMSSQVSSDSPIIFIPVVITNADLCEAKHSGFNNKGIPKNPKIVTNNSSIYPYLMPIPGALSSRVESITDEGEKFFAPSFCTVFITSQGNIETLITNIINGARSTLKVY